MKILPLGTSSGQPTMERGVSALAAFVGSANKWILVDCGEGTIQTIMRAGLIPGAGDAAGAESADRDRFWRLKLTDLEAICITHAHPDHCFGLFGVLLGIDNLGRSKPLKIVAPKEARLMAEAVLTHSHSPISYPLEWIAPEDGLRVELAEGLSCLCVGMAHRAPSHGYLFESSALRLTANHVELAKRGFVSGGELGQAIAALKRGQEAKAPDGSTVQPSEAIEFARVSESLFVGGDNIEPQRVAEKAAGAIAWVHEATYLHEDWEKGGAGIKWGHSSARMIGEAAAQGQPGALVLTHFSPRYGEGERGVERLAQEAGAFYSGPIHLAMDLAPIEFPARVEILPAPETPGAGAGKSKGPA